jgi:hypothetical protein
LNSLVPSSIGLKTEEREKTGRGIQKREIREGTNRVEKVGGEGI